MVSETIILGMILTGSILMISEAIIPGVQFIVVGLTTLVTGLILLVIPIQNPIFIIPIFILIGVITIYTYKNINLTGDEIDRTTDSKDLRFSEGIVKQKITQTDGIVKLNNSNSMSNEFQARCKVGEIEKGEKITVTDTGGGSVLEVMPKKETKIDDMYDLNEEKSKI